MSPSSVEWGTMRFVLLLIISIGASALDYETDDAVVVEADQVVPFTGSLYYFLADLTASKFSKQRLCLTHERRLGVCMPARECVTRYAGEPKEEQQEPQQPNRSRRHRIWVSGSFRDGTCSFARPDGRQYFGVCCNMPYRKNHPANKANVAGSRIVGGSSINNKEEYPFMAAIEKEGQLVCGGTLLDATHILTAAHCVAGVSSYTIDQHRVIMGVLDLEDPNAVIRRIKSITRHKHFNGRNMHNDVALLTLDSPVTFSSTVSPVCLADSDGLDGQESVAVGWGSMHDGGPASNSLRKVTVEVKTQDDCRDNFKTKARLNVADFFMCAASVGKDACTGDSGGPLLVNGCQVAITSWGIGCATDTYGVYTRISSFKNWIERNQMRF